MITKEFTFLSSDGKTTVHAVRWMPDSGEFQAILQITHGMVEYIERYAGFAEFLTGHGYLVVGHDHIGHGQSVTSEEEWGYFGRPNPSDLLIADMHTLRTTIQKEYPGKPYFMMGHSMGSYMLRKYLGIHPEGLNGAVIMGTGYVPRKTTDLGVRVCSVLAFFRGWHYRSKFVADASFGKPYQKYDLTGKTASNSWLTKDEEIVRKYYSDPKCTFVFTVNGYVGLYEAVCYACDPENINRYPKELPVFIVSGADDPVGDLGTGVKKVYDMFQSAGMEDVTYQLYDTDRHEILNELDKERVYNDILAWINVRLA
jgi:alpha-beta hydrolase superfamily lysophospholipase